MIFANLMFSGTKIHILYCNSHLMRHAASYVVNDDTSRSCEESTIANCNIHASLCIMYKILIII